jgi:Tfp pilus assembly protein PilO
VSEPVRLGQILPEVMRKIEKRVEAWAKMSDTKNQNQRSWQFNRRINLSVLIQLVFLASLIVGSWVNLQSQLDLLQHDVTTLLQSQKNFEQKLESLQAKSISYEYRLRVIEKRLPEANIGDESF